MKINKKILKTLPEREWNKVSEYSSIYLVPSGLKHDSGYMMIAIVGIKEDRSLEVCAYPDDINWDLSELKQKYSCTGIRTDCLYPEGVMRFWGDSIRFIVEKALSSTTIKVVNKTPTQ